jgi:3-dehydroquinate synthase/2-deoxy-scyllo-inosose synthase
VNKIEFDSVSIPFHFVQDDFNEILYNINKIDKSGLWVLVDQNLEKHWSIRRDDWFGVSSNVIHYSIVSSEEIDKTLNSIVDLLEHAIKIGIDRSFLLVAVGGGVVGNLVGTVAGLLYRGIRFVHVPTTVVAMTDSVVSLKQGVNSKSGKNHFGLYKSPEAIYCYMPFLKSLCKDHYIGGLCEIVKNSLIFPSNLIELLRNDFDLSDYCSHLELFRETINIKLEILGNDRQEN